MERRFSARLLALAVVAAAAAGSTPASAADAGACRLTATATITPGLTLAGWNATHSITLSGSLSMCGGTAPSGASLSSGNVWTDSQGFKWREPIGTATGGCGELDSALVTIARWEDGRVTIIDTNTTSVLQGVTVRGTVLDSIHLTAVDQQPGQPATLQISSNLFAGGAQGGLLAALPADNGVSCGGSGLTSVPLSGGVGIAAA